MKEIIDRSTGAILFKSDPEDPIEKKIQLLEDKINKLEQIVDKLSNIVEKG